jgi:cytochrome b involved in lipid metabolism
MTKSELRSMIREMLREELSRCKLKESANQAQNFLAIDGFEYSIEDTFEDEGYTGYEVIYSKDGHDIVKVEVWEDGNYVTVIENLYAANLMQRTYETFTQFAEDLEYKYDRYIR